MNYQRGDGDPVRRQTQKGRRPHKGGAFLQPKRGRLKDCIRAPRKSYGNGARDSDERLTPSRGLENGGHR